MNRLLDAIFIVDTKHEQIAVDEAAQDSRDRWHLVDTTCDPDEVDYVLPGNDDALRSIRLFAYQASPATVLAGLAWPRRLRRFHDTKPRSEATIAVTRLQAWNSSAGGGPGAVPSGRRAAASGCPVAPDSRLPIARLRNSPDYVESHPCRTREEAPRHDRRGR